MSADLQRVIRVVEWIIFEQLAENRRDLAEKIGYTESSLSQILNGKVSLSSRFVKKLAKMDDRINEAWLVTGEGEMINNSVPQDDNSSHGEKMIPFYDAEAAAGTSYGMDMSPVSRPSKMIRMGDFLSDSEAAIQVFGNSMTPNYPAGCIVGTKLHTDSFIEPGAVYVIETRDNRYLKRLYYSDDGEHFECESDNHMLCEEGSRKGKPCYPMFKIPFNEVVRLHRVTGVIKRNII